MVQDHREAAPRRTQTRGDTLRRGGALGITLAAHLGLLVWVATLAPDDEQVTHRLPTARGDALQLVFLQSPASRPLGPPHVKRAPAHATRPRTIATASHGHHAPAMAPSPRFLPPMASLHVAPEAPALPDYQPGGFDSALQQARSPRPAFRVPGASNAIPRVAGIALRTPPSSLKQIVQAIGKGQACYAMYTALTHGPERFLTPDQIDHKLEAEGCGPHASKEDSDPTLNAIVRHFLTDQ